MPRQCSRSWSETVPQGKGDNKHATMVLHHGCIRVDKHEGTCRCTCDPVYELRTDFVDFVRQGVFRRA